MSIGKTLLFAAFVALSCLPSLKGQEPMAEKVIYTGRIYCTVEIEGETTNVVVVATSTDPDEACELARRRVTDTYPIANCRPCEISPPPSTIVSPPRYTPTQSLPWTVTYKCRGSDGQLYVVLTDGHSFCEAYCRAKAEAHNWLAAIQVQCCSACYQVLRQPCCKPTWKIMRRR